MAILKVASLGHPVLRRPAVPVEPGRILQQSFQTFLDDLVETMREYEGVGIAATQVHMGERVFAMEVDHHVRYPMEIRVPLTIVINPEIELLPTGADLVEGWEGCLSVPGLRGCVPRQRDVALRGLDRNGEPLSMNLSNLAARIVQHEVDHLNGKVYLDSMSDLKTLSFEKEYERFHRDPV
jgi:peptide deformylase